MSKVKEEIIGRVVEAEGGYVNDPSDSGGETNYGITKHVAREAGYLGPMKDMPRETAFDIYSRKYWHSVRAGDMPDEVAYEVVDTAVNCGVRRAGVFLQRALNVMNLATGLYPDIKVDGNIGPATLSALNAYTLLRDSKELVKALNCLQGAFYIELAERREKDEKFVYGWLKNRVKL